MTEHYHLLDIKELSEGIHKSVRWIRSNLKGCTPGVTPMPCIRLGTRLLFRPSEIDEWLDQYREVELYDPVVEKALVWARGILERKREQAERAQKEPTK